MSTIVDNSVEQSVGREGPRRLGAALRQAWVGYQLRLDREMAAAGFEDRRFPDAKVLRMCAGADPVTISDVGRRLGISRQAASKVVSELCERGYTVLERSPTDRREKVVRLTGLALELLAAQWAAAETVEAQIRQEVGADSLVALDRLLDVLRVDQPQTLRAYLRDHSSGVQMKD